MVHMIKLILPVTLFNLIGFRVLINIARANANNARPYIPALSVCSIRTKKFSDFSILTVDDTSNVLLFDDWLYHV